MKHKMLILLVVIALLLGVYTTYYLLEPKKESGEVESKSEEYVLDEAIEENLTTEATEEIAKYNKGGEILYQSLLDDYKKAIDNKDYSKLNLLSYLQYNNSLRSQKYIEEHIGYTFKDLDKNGVQELIIGFYNLTDTDVLKNSILGVYTVQSNTITPIIVPWAYEKGYILKGGQILNKSLGGADYDKYTVYNVDNYKLVVSKTYRWQKNKSLNQYLYSEYLDYGSPEEYTIIDKDEYKEETEDLDSKVMKVKLRPFKMYREAGSKDEKNENN